MKKFLLSLLLFFGSIISFSSAGSFNITGYFNYGRSFSTTTPLGAFPFPIVYNFDCSDCVYYYNCNFSNYTGSAVDSDGVAFRLYRWSNTLVGNIDIKTFNSSIIKNSLSISGSFTSAKNLYFTFVWGTSSSNIYFDYDCTFTGDNIRDLTCPSCDVMTSSECQSNYDLIPISDVDQEYCLGNSLCPEIENGSGDCENESGDVQWSALYINDIQHLGKPLINIDIPDYIFWDYSTDDEEFNLYVGSGYDQEYIDNVISINSYRPDSQDFTDIFVGGLTFIFPYIVIVLFIVFVRKLIKRIFK